MTTTPHEDDYLEIHATITDRDGNETTVYAGSMQRWAIADAKHFAAWKKARRSTVLLGQSIYDMTGYRVAFTVSEPLS